MHCNARRWIYSDIKTIRHNVTNAHFTSTYTSGILCLKRCEQRSQIRRGHTFARTMSKYNARPYYTILCHVHGTYIIVLKESDEIKEGPARRPKHGMHEPARAETHRFT